MILRGDCLERLRAMPDNSADALVTDPPAGISFMGKDWDGYTGERQNFHPTVKPLRLMTYLIRMICPPGGLCLDPFAGSGTTGVAAVSAGFRFVGIEREAEYAAIAEVRIAHATQLQGEMASA